MNRNYLLIIPIILLLLSACGEGNQQSASHLKVFKYNESQGISSLDPAYARNVENIWAVNHLFSTLIELDEELNIVPSLATDWEISDDGLTYTFFLRRDVYFHDHEAFKGGRGRKVVAQDFVYSFLRITDQKVASPGAWIFSNIDRTTPDHLGFKAIDRHTLEIKLLKPFQPFLGLLSMKYCSVVPHEIVEHYGADFRSNPIGSGPFKFKYWKEGNKLVLLKNESYFEKDAEGVQLPYIDAVNIGFIGDEEVEYLEFLKGNLDFLSGSVSSNERFLKEEGGLKEDFKGQFDLLTTPYLNTEYLGILMDSTQDVMKKHPLNDKLIRRAINIGFNRSDMIKYLKNNVGTPANEGFIPKGLKPYKKGWIKGHHYDPDSARILLEMAGYPNGNGLQTIKLTTTAQYLTLCEFIQSQLSELGFKIEIELNPAATNREMVALSKTAFFRKSWIADYADAENYMALFYSGNFSPNGPNYTHFKNIEFDRLYEACRVELEADKRSEMYRRMEEIILEECPVVPLFYDQVVRYKRQRVEGIGINPMNLLDLRNVRLNAAGN